MMRIIHDEFLYQLTFLPKIFPVNCYFVREDDGLTLLDTALPYSAEGIVTAAKTLNIPIVRIVLTHAHGDHIGALDTLKKELPNASVSISCRDARLLRGDRTLDADEPNSPIRGGLPKPNTIQTTPDHLLKDGDRIGSLLAISTPGHTPGSMSFIDTRNQSLIAGDAFQTRGGFAVAGQFRPLFPFPAMATWNKEAAMHSARRIREFRPTLLAVGHGVMVKNPIEFMDRAIER